MFDIFKYFKKEPTKGNISEVFFKKTKDKESLLKNCHDCKRKNDCQIKEYEKDYLCSFVKDINNYDPKKPSIILLDDNPGVLSFLEDDLRSLNIKDYNIIKFDSKYAGFNLVGTLKSYKGLNIQYCIFDLTFGGGVYNEIDGNVILDGVDVLKECLYYNKDIKYFFFTGNTLNTYIKKNKEMVDKFKNITSKDITDFILYKTKLNPKDRRNYIKNFLES